MPLGLDVLEELAAPLGADVPFFVRGGTQLGTGTGTTLQRWSRPEWLESAEFVLVLPPFGTSTVVVYKNFRPQLRDDRPLTTLTEFESGLARGNMKALRNDLEPAAERAYPALAALRSELAERRPEVLLSGSGSTLLVPTGPSETAATVVESLRPLADRHGASLVAVGSAPASAIFGSEG